MLQSGSFREFRLVFPPASLLEAQAEMWPSGRRHTPAKGADGEPSRGFESLRLRQRDSGRTFSGNERSVNDF